MRILLFCLLVLTPLVAAEHLPQPLGSRGEAVLADDFERSELGRDYRSPIPSFRVEGGLLRGRQEHSDHGGTLTRVMALPGGNVMFACRFRFAGARSFSVCCDDRTYRGAHAGHISRVVITPTLLTLFDDKEGVMRNDIYALRRADDRTKKEEGNRLAEPATRRISLKLEPDRWYRLGLEIVGDRMRVTIDDREVGHLQSPGLAHSTKPDLRLSVWGKQPDQEVHFDEMRVWSISPLDGTGDIPVTAPATL